MGTGKHRPKQGLLGRHNHRPVLLEVQWYSGALSMTDHYRHQHFFFFFFTIGVKSSGDSDGLLNEDLASW